VIYCFKVGWKFALFFDLDRPERLDSDRMALDLGTLYRRLSFQHVYEVLENEAKFEEMLKDGWFPFVELIGEDYKDLSLVYQDRFDFDNRINTLVTRFGSTRIERITKKWWGKKIFNDKRAILEAGANAFLQGSNDGYINCIKTLLSEAEGIIRIQYFNETGKGKHVTVNDLLLYLIEKGKKRTGSDYSLLLPVPFLQYLKDAIYPNFYIEKSLVGLSRHTSSHGVAEAEAYTRVRALQVILLIDQISFYI
jgi:hypothetical protein